MPLIGKLPPASTRQPLRFRLAEGHEVVDDDLVESAAAGLRILIRDQVATGTQSARKSKLTQAGRKAESPAVGEIRKTDANGGYPGKVPLQVARIGIGLQLQQDRCLDSRLESFQVHEFAVPEIIRMESVVAHNSAHPGSPYAAFRIESG